MPVPDFTDPDRRSSRLGIQIIVAGCFIAVAIISAFCSWRIAATTDMIDHVTGQQAAILEQQVAILREIRDARSAIPDEVKSAIPDVLRGKIK